MTRTGENWQRELGTRTSEKLTKRTSDVNRRTTWTSKNWEWKLATRTSKNWDWKLATWTSKNWEWKLATWTGKNWQRKLATWTGENWQIELAMTMTLPMSDRPRLYDGLWPPLVFVPTAVHSANNTNGRGRGQTNREQKQNDSKNPFHKLLWSWLVDRSFCGSDDKGEKKSVDESLYWMDHFYMYVTQCDPMSCTGGDEQCFVSTIALKGHTLRGKSQTSLT